MSEQAEPGLSEPFAQEDAAARSGSVPEVPDGVPHVVVVGGGFAGVACVRALADAPVRVTLVDRRIYNTFNPLLYQVASGGLNPGDVTYFLRSLHHRQPNVRVVHEHLVGVDAQARTITLLNDEVVHYDHLVLANGVTTNYFDTPGAKEHAFAMYSRSQALKIRDTLFVRLEVAASTPRTDDGLRVVVVGGGPTGVEVAGALAELRDQGLRPAYPEVDGDAFSVTLVQRGDEVLKSFLPRLRRYGAAQLRRRDVDLRLGAGVAAVHPDAVELTDGTRIPSDLTVWATGVHPHPEVERWGLPLGHGGRIRVDREHRVEGVADVYAVGDVSISPDDLPQLAQPAIQAGGHVGKNIAALVAGGRTTPLHYLDKGTMAIIGRRAAIAQLFGKVPVTSGIAWLLWLFVHIMGLMGGRNRLTTLAGLVTRYGFPFHRRPVPIVGDVPTVRPPKPGKD
ncbi:NAD(P)/FAD-dependent oxidoreductase [Cellulomonas sp. PhB143]|uniref:NAD(P)/FAD-dependent oxidoreductase n=1 Tax=Cellulomonas sp. PhB143 TaxID=2485186 RepID=UPI000FC267BE|nr:FAD-dependent oxidoreductase [Cellulomonas sp. PhB143]ROS79163.1 NADH dehydrogenase [Cellulomonas sp. PhB143]